MMTSASTTVRHIMLTGSPGVGKTTLIQKVCKELERKKIPTKGFYTSEIRENGRRTGFDVISLDGRRSSLARIGENGHPKVGQYAVQLQSFESISLPALRSEVPNCVTVIDEIGKMELFSKSFETTVRKILFSQCVILGTIPLQKGKPLQLVEFLRNHPSVRVISVNFQNRDQLVPEIVDWLLCILKSN